MGFGCIFLDLDFCRQLLFLFQATEQIQRLYELFCKVDATQVEINPFGETPDGQGKLSQSENSQSQSYSQRLCSMQMLQKAIFGCHYHISLLYVEVFYFHHENDTRITVPKHMHIHESYMYNTITFVLNVEQVLHKIVDMKKNIIWGGDIEIYIHYR